MEVVLHRINTIASMRVVERAGSLLSRDEVDRAARFRNDADHRRYVLTRARLREVLGERLGLRPGEVTLVTEEHGKPRLAPSLGSDLQFSCSHAGDLAVIALASTHVGVDIEPLRPIGDVVELAAEQFAEAELYALRRAPENDRTALFLRHWTLKEAALKAIGVGIAAGMAHFVVAADEPRQHLRSRDLLTVASKHRHTATMSRTEQVVLLRFTPLVGYVGAVAVLAQDIDLRWHT